MTTRKWGCITLFAVALMTAPGLMFANGLIKSPELLDRIKAGVTTSQQVTEILGPPARVQKFARRDVEAWDYWIPEHKKRIDVSVEINNQGVVSNVQRFEPFCP